MFSRTLLVALCIVYATPLTPLSTQGDDDCALYLTGPGRSSAYDYSLNLLKGNFAYDGQHTCITYEAINQAYLDARTRILVSQPKGDWKAENFASIGELLLDISISLARIYGLTYEEIEKGLPLIDTSRTLIREVCPPVFSHVECRAGKYRRLDGLCNNLRHPTWGATMAPFQRLIGPLFADGINAPRISHTGRDLPLSRVVSRTMHPDDGFHDHAGTVMVIAWGQFMDHDYTLTGTPLDPVHRNDPEECCKRPPHLKHPYCNEIRVPDDDYFYRLFGVKCIDFVRGFPSPRPGCRLGSRVPFNTLTGAIDGNTVYGVTEKFARKLRTGYSGLLRMNPVFKEYGLKDLLPLKLDIPDEGCTRPNKNMFCFEAGEIRVNEQLVLTVMHTLMAREHNRVAEALALVNPHWDDETLFQESRRINIAEIQHITYNEFLPILLGKDVMEKFGLVLEKEGYWDGYDQNVNPDVIASFAAAAYRFGHSLLPTAVERWSKAHKFIASKRLSDLIRRPYDLYRAGVLDEYVMGLMNQVAQAMDDSITQEVTNHLFKKVGARFGMDLVSFNMQRGREFGLPGYMEFRKFCGLSGADTFQDLFGSMANETIQKYESIFEHPIDVDLWSGGVSERPLPGSMLGPTFACIIATQFSYSRRGDRFWFELPNQPSSFTPEQIVELRKARLARVICDNTDIIDTVQLYPMVLPDHELNPRVPCRSGIIPSMDFSKWAEPTPFLGGAKEYMTDAHICNQTTQDNKGTTTDRSDDCTINDPTNDFLEHEDCRNDDLVLIANNNDKDKPSETQTNNTDNKINITTNLEENCENVMENSAIKLNDQVKNNDKVLKYVYKKTDINASNKTKGHVKNSLKRKKRSLLSDSEILAHRQPRKFQINDHQTDREEIAVPQTKPQGIINRDDLADFNIETLHENIKPSINILMKDNKGFVSNQKQKHNTKKHGNDEIDVNDHRDKNNHNIKSTASDSDDIPTKYLKKSKNIENDEHDKNEEKNVNSTVYDRDSINNDYIDESISIENNSNEYIENVKEKLSQEIEDGSSDYDKKDSRNIKSDSFNKDGRRNDYTKESKNDNDDSNEYDVKDTRNIKSDSFNKDGRRTDYTKESKNDNDDSNEFDVKDTRNIKKDSFNKNGRRTDYTKEFKNDNDDSNEFDVKDTRNIKSDSFNKNGRRNDYIKESKNDNNESNEYDVKDSRNIKSDSFNKNGRRTDYTKESKNDNDDSNEFDVKDTRNIKSDSFNKNGRRNDYIKESKNDNNESNEYDVKDSRNTKSDSFNKNGRRTDYTKESKNDNDDSNEFDVKDTRNIKGDSFNRNGRRNDYIKESKNDNNESNEYDVKDSRNIKSDSFNKNGRRTDYTKESKNDNDESNEFDVKDTSNKKKDSFNKNGRRTDYTRESKNDHDDSNEYDVKDTRNIKSDSFNKNGRRNDYIKESKNNNNESSEYGIKDTRNIKSASFDKHDRSNDYTKESKNDNNESHEYDIKDSRNINNASFNKGDRLNNYTKETKNVHNERNEFEGKDIENIKSLNYENRKRNKQYSNIDEGSKARNEDYLTDYKDTLKSDEILDADFLEEGVPTPKNNLSDKNLDILKKHHTNNNSEIVSHEDLKETSYESNEKVKDLEEIKLLNKDNEEVFTGNKKQNNSINLQEVDLDDFNYESLEDDKDQSSAHNKNDRSTLSENVAVIPNTLEKPFTGRNSKKPPLIDNANKNEKQIKINDDEIKPVKELNYSESQSEEESKEYKESDKSEDKELSINDRLKSVIEKSHKLYPNSKTEKENTDLKAQFERIPENYIHTDVKNSTEKNPLIENSGEEGTLDSFTPINYEYDKDLNIKFSDLTIKLPEIKLPEDIIAYAREGTKNHKEDYDNSEHKEKDNSEDKEKDNSRDKENEEEQEDEELEDYISKPKIHRNNKQNGEDFYQSYFNPSVDLSNDNPQKKDKYSNFHNEESGEDLYEKFVRERFGKKKDLKKKSEKLIDYNPVSKNYDLYKTVRKALKRANKIEKEAEKSKDPNYMWTLEYGGKL